jgi:hypothetical protein
MVVKIWLGHLWYTYMYIWAPNQAHLDAIARFEEKI